MKKYLIVLFLFLSLAFADKDCHENIPLEIHFLDSTIWYNSYSFSSGCYAVVADTLSETLEDGYRCSKEGIKSEKAFLDSNVFLYRGLPPGVHPQPGENILYIYSVSVATHSLGDVFRDEFLHWQQCGMLSLTYEEADSLVSSLVEVMNEKFANERCYCYKSDKINASDYPGDSPDQIVTWSNEVCATVPIAQSYNVVRMDIVFENGLARIPERLIGQKYFVFDLNGKVLQQGLAEETIRMPNTLAILKIGNENPVLLKN
ncbi:MAG: hypothetical protein K6E57_08585 [Fibrobacter sp.]|nr:hypothetical protein [Fibrobacter sp.]